jgi:hypothetical protein
MKMEQLFGNFKVETISVSLKDILKAVSHDSN